LGIDITLPSPYSGGKVYFIIQSVDSGGSLTFGPGGNITQESDISWSSAQQYDFRYDSFEVSLESNAGDEGNLTEINGFGIPMNLTVAYQDGSPTQTRGYNVNGNDLFQQIAAFRSPLASYPFSAGPLAIMGEQRMTLSPAEAVGQKLPGANASDWDNYLGAVSSLGSGTIRITGFFNGATSADAITFGTTTSGGQTYHNPGFYAYDLSYENTNGGQFLLTPEANSQIKGAIQISTADLANSIYSTLGNATILTSSGGSPVLEMNTGANNEWGAVFVKFLVGFVGGYYGGTGEQLNPLLGSGGVDLNVDWNFDPTYAFGGTPGGPVVTHSASVTSGTYYDGYAKIFFDHGNAYGNGYSDALMNAFVQGGPLVGVANADGSDVNTIDITLFDDNEPKLIADTFSSAMS